MSLEEEPEVRREPVNISRASFMLLLSRIPFDESVEALLGKIDYGDSNNLMVEFLFDGQSLAIRLSEKPSMMFRKK